MLLLAIFCAFIFIKIAPMPASSCGQHVEVQAGDSCWAISSKNGLSLTQLAELNPAVDCARLQPGDMICVAVALNHSCETFHSVVAGDTCYDIAIRFQQSVQVLKTLNPSMNCDSLQLSQLICVKMAAASMTSCVRNHTVVSGDTCYGLGLSPEEFRSLNPGLDCNELSIGSQICISDSISPTSPSVASGPSVADYEDYVKYLFLSAHNFEIFPEPLRCTDVDPDKRFIWYFPATEEGLRLCDICHYFPADKLVNIVIDVLPFEAFDNVNFTLCFDQCASLDECVALSFDQISEKCFLFNTTQGRFKSEHNWVSVLMNQPVEIVEKWIYSRHTKLSSAEEPTSQTSELSFMSCLQRCEEDSRCLQLNYDLLSNRCSLYATQHEGQMSIHTNLEYGHVTAFRIEFLHQNSSSIAWRFSKLESENASHDSRSMARHSGVCETPVDEKLGNFYNPQCQIVGSLAGCSSEKSGCQSCYYPEKSTELRSDLPICLNSRTLRRNDVAQASERCFEKCLRMDDCSAVDIADDGNCRLVTISRSSCLVEGTRYELLHPSPSSPLAAFSYIVNSNLADFPDGVDSFIEITHNVKLLECVNRCFGNRDCVKASYSPSEKRCKLAKNEIGFALLNATYCDDTSYVTFIRKPALDRSIAFFRRTPGWSIDAEPALGHKSLSYEHSSVDALEQCLKECMSSYDNTCKYVSVRYETRDRVWCTFYNNSDHTMLESEFGEIFTRTLADLNLQTLNAMPVWQAEDLGKCFQQNTIQTQTTLAGSKDILAAGATEVLSDTQGELLVRHRRGFLDSAWKGIKEVGGAVIDGVKDTVKAGVDTVKGAGNAVAKFVQGDFKGAGKALVETPLVKAGIEAGENFVKLGGAIAKGDLEGIGKAALGLATSDLLDVIPVGRIGKIGTKTLTKLSKEANERAKKSLTDEADDVVKKGVSKDKRTKRGDKDKRPDADQNAGNNRCPRATAKGKKRTRPGQDCDDDDNDNAKGGKCRKPSVSNVIQKSLSECHLKHPGSTCKFECKPGYKENTDTSRCTKVPGSKTSAWSPDPACDEQSCGGGPFPQISVTSGSVTSYVVKFDKGRKLPMWSIAFHDRMNIDKSIPRTRGFKPYPCAQLKNHQAKNGDYRYSRWDKGHLTPAVSMRFSLKASVGSNSYINVAPQDPWTNQVPWKALEGHVGCYLNRNTGLIVTGTCPNSIGRTKTGGIDVPACFWKMICYRAASRVNVVGFKSDNTRVTSNQQREPRRQQIKNPVSQADILTLMGPYSVHNPWIQSATEVYKGRGVGAAASLATGGSVPVTTAECGAQLSLESAEATLWKNALEGKNSARRRRDSTEDTRGCTASEMRDMAAYLGLPTLNIDELNIDPIDEDEDDDDGDDADDENADDIPFAKASSCGKRIVGYFPSWGKVKFTAKQAKRLTHVIFAFMEMKEDGSIAIGSADPGHSTSPSDDADLAAQRLEQLFDVADRFSHLKVQFAVGGWENSQYFSGMAANAEKRLKFMASTLKLIDLFGFDGIDIDWEYPVTGGAHEGVPDDKGNYVILMKELRQVLDEFQKQTGRDDKFIISFAGAAGQWTLDPGFDLPALLEYADWANVMTYDFFGPWDSKWGAYTGPPAPLYFAMPKRFSGKTNVDFAMKYYVCRSKQPEKINMGVPFYGRFWRNVGGPIDASDPMWRVAEAKDGKFEGGFVGWKEINADYLTNPAFTHSFHPVAKTPYAINAAERIYLGYENAESLQYKVDYAVEKNLGGLMIWALDQDDEDGTLLDIVSKAPLCRASSNDLTYRCSPLSEQRWWTSDDDLEKAGMCGRMAPLYKGFYPLCDPDDPGYSCCGAFGYCGNGPEFCSCPTCVNYRENPNKLLDEPIKPTLPDIRWHLMDAPDGQRGRCGPGIAKINNRFAICNPDDPNAHCCSRGGYCGNTPEYCTCDGCVDFKANPNHEFPQQS